MNPLGDPTDALTASAQLQVTSELLPKVVRAGSIADALDTRSDGDGSTCSDDGASDDGGHDGARCARRRTPATPRQTPDRRPRVHVYDVAPLERQSEQLAAQIDHHRSTLRELHHERDAWRAETRWREQYLRDRLGPASEHLLARLEAAIAATLHPPVASKSAASRRGRGTDGGAGESNLSMALLGSKVQLGSLAAGVAAAAATGAPPPTFSPSQLAAAQTITQRLREVLEKLGSQMDPPLVIRPPGEPAAPPSGAGVRGSRPSQASMGSSQAVLAGGGSSSSSGGGLVSTLKPFTRATLPTLLLPPEITSRRPGSSRRPATASSLSSHPRSSVLSGRPLVASTSELAFAGMYRRDSPRESDPMEP
ncbi:hypothetical protein CXG81DRAFT_19135 [Caulochytrium protostelioides]|uniref:Uncharacterized protein n=1 Tax=Caulochytrium protostelioides TaxID=1555241 RepID=A0A4P9X735_9FUNG|nr:hypothetical protein CXG81DRAFT_19135 [Caulochytrium protostelioides]|eukprot:RKP01036.1 hypothetical protein CXG81DRAFT_19135 [Caulochytrium protostelioides]